MRIKKTLSSCFPNYFQFAFAFIYYYVRDRDVKDSKSMKGWENHLSLSSFNETHLKEREGQHPVTGFCLIHVTCMSPTYSFKFLQDMRGDQCSRGTVNIESSVWVVSHILLGFCPPY